MFNPYQALRLHTERPTLKSELLNLTNDLPLTLYSETLRPCEDSSLPYCSEQ
jgi:hypothetical protein